MRANFGSRKPRDAQTLVFFLLAWGSIMLLCGLAIDSGLLYLAKARMGRAVDGAALAAVGNFNRTGTIAGGETQVQANRDAVAVIMRNFAVANYTDLTSISSDIPSSGGYGGTAGTYTLPSGGTGTTYSYNFNDGTTDPNGQYRRFVQVTLTTGSGGAITSATCNARCPVQTYFISYGWSFFGATTGLAKNGAKLGGYSGPSGLGDLKVSSSAVATRNPRLIMVVIDRSASMLQPGGGASGLPPAVVQFLNFFDTSSDNIGIVSFGSSARLEMPLTTNFLIAGTNNLIDAYQTNSAGAAEPGVDPESVTTNVVPPYDPNYATTGIRRLKFGGDTAADDGIRLAIEQMMANPGFNDPNVVKYMVIFTDGKWNASRTLAAAPGYINEVAITNTSATPTAVFLTNQTAAGMSNGQYVGGPQGGGPWDTDLANDTNLVAMPSLGLMSSRSSIPYLTNAIGLAANQTSYYPNTMSQIIPDHTNDTWQSVDYSGLEPLGNASGTAINGDYMGVTNTAWVGQSDNGKTNYFTHNVDVWLQPGSVAFYYTNGSTVTPVPYVSDYTNPTKHVNLYVGFGGKVDLVVPGYIVDGILFDGIDLPYSYPEDPSGNYTRYRCDNYNQPFMWPDDASSGSIPTGSYYQTYYADSLERQLMFRNYPNLLTGFYVFRADEPVGSGIEPLITDESTNGVTGAPRARWGLGAYYPSAGFYWPFGGDVDNHGYVTNAVGADTDPTYALPNPNSDPSTSLFSARHIAYSINMLSTNAAPEWYGELFYKSISGAGTNTVSGTGGTSASQIMVSSDWQNGEPNFVATLGSISGLMVSEATHNTTITPNPSVWRPASFNGSAFGSYGIGAVVPGASSTGGWVSDGAGHYYKNTMAWSGRPTHYFDFSQSKWVPILDNHHTSPNREFLQLGNWKAEEYAWHARALGVTIFTVGYGTLVSPAQCASLAQIANATNVAAPDTSGAVTNGPSAYNPGQPLGEQFYATNAAQIEQDFYSVGQAINAALTQ